jgi:hypothetical protein
MYFDAANDGSYSPTILSPPVRNGRYPKYMRPWTTNRKVTVSFERLPARFIEVSAVLDEAHGKVVRY